MSNIPAMKPTESIGSLGDTVKHHPAFGCVQVSRVSVGGKGETLFGSPVKVSSYISLAVKRADGRARGLSEAHHANDTIVSVMMSEGQWASLLSSLNVGGGVAATIERAPAEGTRIERYPAILRESDAEHRQKAIDISLTENLSKVMAAAEALSTIAEAKGVVSKTELKTAVHNLNIALRNAPSNFAFAAEQVTTHMQKVSDALKVELNQHAMAVGLTSGFVEASLEDHSDQDIIDVD